MKTNKATTRTAHIVDTGGKLSSSAGLVTPASAYKPPKPIWNTVKKEDIGTGYVAIELATEKQAKRRAERDDPIWHNRFIKGSSEFIWFWVHPKPAPVAVKAKPKKQPLNYRNKLDKKTRGRFTSEMGLTIDRTANFMMKDILPHTVALNSGLAKADELLKQLGIEEKVPLPVSYLQGKVITAVHLRIIRFVSRLFELNEEEKKLMVAEFTRPWSQS